MITLSAVPMTAKKSFNGLLFFGGLKNKKRQRSWTPEARKRHLAGSKRFQRERIIYNTVHVLKEFAEQHGYDF